LGLPLYLINKSRIGLGYSLYSNKYRITDFSSIDSTANANLIELDSLGWRFTSSGSATFTRDTRDNVFFPTSGSQITLYSELAGGPFGGDFDYYKQIAQVSWFTETYQKFVLRTKWRASYIQAYGKSKEVPPDQKFYLGGTGPDGIRGYPDRSVGPVNGGTRAVIFSTELGYPIGGDAVVALLFFDAGNSYNTLREFNFLQFKKGAGAGVRIRSPFGLIGFDYAFNFEKHNWEPHFQFGTTF
jgi:outer membrane protein insertion porin family